MRIFEIPVRYVFVAMLGLTYSGIACATPVTMDFDDFAVVADIEMVANYYNGGCTNPGSIGGATTCGGPDYGVTWSDAAAGYYQRLLGMPSTPNTMSISGFRQAVMNVAVGFGTSLSFQYLAVSPGRNTATVAIYGGAGGAGELLATTKLQRSSCTGHYYRLSCWASLDMTFDGIAHSAVFTSTRRVYLRFDDISLDVGAPGIAVPEPPMPGIFGLAALFIILLAHRSRRRLPQHLR